MDTQKVRTACLKVAEAFTILADAVSSTTEVMQAAKEAADAIRPSSPVPVAVPAPESSPAPTEYLPSSAEVSASVSDAEAVPPVPETSTLESLGRAELKTLAESLGLTVTGKKAAEIRVMIQTARGEGPVAPTYTVAQMKDDLEAFIRLNQEALEEADFFNDQPTGDPENPTYDEMMASDDLIKAAWVDNVKPYIDNGQWPEMKAQAAALV